MFLPVTPVLAVACVYHFVACCIPFPQFVTFPTFTLAAKQTLPSVLPPHTCFEHLLLVHTYRYYIRLFIYHTNLIMPRFCYCCIVAICHYTLFTTTILLIPHVLTTTQTCFYHLLLPTFTFYHIYLLFIPCTTHGQPFTTHPFYYYCCYFGKIYSYFYTIVATTIRIIGVYVIGRYFSPSYTGSVPAFTYYLPPQPYYYPLRSLALPCPFAFACAPFGLTLRICSALILGLPSCLYRLYWRAIFLNIHMPPFTLYPEHLTRLDRTTFITFFTLPFVCHTVTCNAAYVVLI